MAIQPVLHIVLIFSRLKLSHEFLSLGHQKSLLFRNLCYSLQLAVWCKNSEVLFVFICEEHQLAAAAAFTDQLNVPEKFFEGEVLGGEDLLVIFQYLL